MPAMTTLLDRRAAVAALLRDPAELIVVTGLGTASYDAFAAGDRDGNYYLWGAMGSAALVGLGIAQAQPNRFIVVITGDGEQLMGLGGLATIAIAKPQNLSIFVLDNQRFGETGMQPSHTAHGLNLAEVAIACGFSDARMITDMNAVEALRSELHQSAPGPRLFVLNVKAEELPRRLPPRDAIYLKRRLRAFLGLTSM
jgi:thiamine pyrophosphate-dependent acetolactate synthase large subunit-like protein